MPKVGVSNEPLLERALFAFDGADWRPVLVDASGNLVAGLLAGSSIAVTQSDDTLLKATVALKADQNVQARGYGWVGAAWQKQPLPFGYSAVVSERKISTTLAAGTNSLSTTAVPAGEIHVYTHVSFYYAGTVATVTLTAYLNIGGSNKELAGVSPPVSSVIYDRQGWFVLAPGDTVQVYCFNATLNDDMALNVAGFRVDIDQ